MLRSAIANCLVMLVVSGVACAQAEKPINASVCDLKDNPDAYNHKLIQVEGTVSYEFENFSLNDGESPGIQGYTLADVWGRCP